MRGVSLTIGPDQNVCGDSFGDWSGANAPASMARLRVWPEILSRPYASASRRFSLLAEAMASHAAISGQRDSENPKRFVTSVTTWDAALPRNAFALEDN